MYSVPPGSYSSRNHNRCCANDSGTGPVLGTAWMGRDAEGCPGRPAANRTRATHRAKKTALAP